MDLEEPPEKLTREVATYRAHDWNAKSHDRWSQLSFTSVLWVRHSREIPKKHSILSIYHI